MYSFLMATMLNVGVMAPAEIPDVDSAAGMDSATIRVHLPTDARLYFDGEATQSTSSVREFTTPLLREGKTYCYTIVGKVVRDGRTITDRKEVDIRAGQVIEMTLDLPRPPRPPAPATLIVRLPADTQLTIDGESMQNGGSVREIESPPLKPGQTYTYTVVGQVVRDGRIVTARKEVDVRADEVTEVALDLPALPVGYGLMEGGSIYNPQDTMAGRGIGGFAGGGGFSGGGFIGGGMPFTPGGGGNSGHAANALINGRPVYIGPAGGMHGGFPHGMPGGGMHGRGRP